MFVLLQRHTEKSTTTIDTLRLLKADVITNFRNPYNHHLLSYLLLDLWVLLKEPLNWVQRILRKSPLHFCKNSPLGIIGVTSQPHRLPGVNHLPLVRT